MKLIFMFNLATHETEGRVLVPHPIGKTSNTP
jgi:hypothetical protein